MENTNTGITSGPAQAGGLGWMPIAVVFIIISAALGGMVAYDKFLTPGLDEDFVTATVRVDYGNGTVSSEVVATGNYTALGMLEEVVGHENLDMTHYQGMGWLVNKINGIGNGDAVEGIDDTGNYYWQYYVNDELGPVAADRLALQGDDVLEWRFEEIIW